MPFNHILVAVHPDPKETTAPNRAAAIARHCDATLHLHMVLWKPNLARDLFHLSDEGKADQEELLQQGAARLANIREELDVPVETAQVHWGHPFHEPLLEVVEAEQPDLVVLATTRDDHPSTSEWHLIRGCRTPLFVCHHHDWNDPPRTLACVDPRHAHDKDSSVDREILALAERLGASLKQPYELLHAAGMTPMGKGDQPYTYQYRAKHDGENEAAIRELLPPSKADEVPMHFSHSTPVEAIRPFVKERRFDICVLGLINRSRWKELLIGSTPRDLIPTMNCDLLLVPHPSATWVSMDPENP
ncbi:MAG: universal stress protein [Pseudomonadota bacterium]